MIGINNFGAEHLGKWPSGRLKWDWDNINVSLR
jgi:hypothetical protein